MSLCVDSKKNYHISFSAPFVRGIYNIRIYQPRQDREPLVQITPVEPTLQEKMKEARKDYPMDSEEAKAEFLKVGGARESNIQYHIC